MDFYKSVILIAFFKIITTDFNMHDIPFSVKLIYLGFHLPISIKTSFYRLSILDCPFSLL